MPLICTDFGFISIEGVPLLVICADDLFQRLHVYWVCFGDACNQRFDVCPAMLV